MQNQRLRNAFDHDTEMWQIYDAAQSVELLKQVGPERFHDIYYAPTWERTGGVNNSGYIWADDARWSLDEPETPRSILALMVWRQWYLRGPVDLRNARLSVYLRGDGLDLKGGRCLFWAQSWKLSTRWHLSERPLSIARGKWPDAPIQVQLADDESQWHRSWTVPGSPPATLANVLAEVEVYGFSFVGFSEKVTGKFAIDEFELKPAKP